MKVEILQLIDGARAARGLTVVIDVFRAFSLEGYLLDMGATHIYPVGDEALARKMKTENPDAILAGERGGKILPRFDLGNSPSAARNIEVSGKCVIHTTSAGTQGVANATGADMILGASLLNARATANYIIKSGAEQVSLVCMGLEAKAPTDEDTLCAEYIRSILLGEELDISERVYNLRYTSGAKFFDSTQSDVFPEEDFHMCTLVDKFDFVIKIDKDECGRFVSRRVNADE